MKGEITYDNQNSIMINSMKLEGARCLFELNK